MATKTTPGRRPNFDDDDVADAISDLRSNNTPITPTAVSTWLNEAGIAKSPNSEALKKSVQRVLDREQEEEERRLLAALPSWITDQLKPGVEQLAAHLRLLVARVHDQQTLSLERSAAEASASIRLRDDRIAALEEEVRLANERGAQSSERLERVNKRIASLTAEKEKLQKKVIEVSSAKAALEGVVKALKPTKTD